MKQKIYIECTHTFGTNILTGIQRVVRNIVMQSLVIESDTFEVIPVVFHTNQFFSIKTFPTHHYETGKTSDPSQTPKSRKRKISSSLIAAAQYLSKNRLPI